MSRSVQIPQPPYPVELIADLHAENLPPGVESRLWPLVRRDPQSIEVLHALDRVTDQLRALGADTSASSPIPEDVAARLNAALHLPPVADAGPDTTIHQFPMQTPGSWHGPHNPASVEAYAGFGARYRRRKRALVASAVAASAAAVVVAVSMSVVANRSQEHSSTAVALPTADKSDTPIVDLGNDLTPATLLNALGRHDEHGFASNRVALNECLSAAGIQQERPLLGSSPVRFDGKDAVLLLLGGPHAPQITALIVSPKCSAAQPEVLAKTDIG